MQTNVDGVVAAAALVETDYLNWKILLESLWRWKGELYGPCRRCLSYFRQTKMNELNYF